MTQHQIPTLERARCIVAVMQGEKPADVAARAGVTTAALAGWRRSLESDVELRQAVSVVLRHALTGWRPHVQRVLVRLCRHVEHLLDNPGAETALDAESAVGSIKALAGVVAQVDELRRRAGLRDEDEIEALTSGETVQ